MKASPASAMTPRFRIGAIVLGLLASLAGVELVLRAMNMGFGNSPMASDPFLHHVHPKNYTFVQQHPSGELGGFVIQYDAEGRVVRGGASAPRAIDHGERPCRVALMGDSFTEGGQVPFEQSFAGLLEQAGRRCEVRNYGVRSYSPAIYLVQWTREVQDWHPTHVFVLLFGNDVREDVRYLQTAVMDADGWPVAIRGPRDGWLFAHLRRSFVARFVRMVTQRATWVWQHYGEDQWTIGGVVEENPEWGGPTPGLVSELNRRVHAAGAQLVVMAVPSRYQLMGDGKIKVSGDFHQTLQSWSGAQAIQFLDLYSAFERAARAGIPVFFLQDIHFTDEGHALVAAMIARAFPDLFENGLVGTPATVNAR